MAQPSYERQIQYQQQVLQMPETLNPLTNISNMSGGQKPKLSRLELMRQHYEKKRQKDVEERMAEMRAQQERTGSGKVNSGGTVRAFFAERRAMEATMKDPYALPPIDRHFRKVKDSSNSAPPRQQTRNGSEVHTPPAQNKHSKSAGKRRPAPQYYRKRSKGVDKQNPLPPVQRGHTSTHKPPTPNKRYETHHTLTTDDSKDETSQQQQEAVHVPKPPQQPNPLRNQTTRPAVESDFDESSSNYSDDPSPNLAKLKALRKKRLSKQMSLVKQESSDKPTDFQKWQMEQDKERAERLEKHNQRTSKPQKKAEVTLSMRERELLAKIQAEQDKLKEIKRLQQELEEQDKVENEEDSSYELMVADDTENYYQKQDSVYEESKPDKILPADRPVQPKIHVKKDNKTQVHVQPKKEKVTQVTIKKPFIPYEEDTDETEPKVDFTAFYEQAAQNDEEVDLDLSPCSICGRNFATERLARHEKICNKNSRKTRKVFDVRKHRVAGTEHEKYIVSGAYKKEPPKPKKADWRVQHENFIKTIRYAKGGSDEPPPVTENPHYVACPYCERKFNPDTAERHIPRCKDTKARPAPPPKNNRTSRKR